MSRTTSTGTVRFLSIATVVGVLLAVLGTAAPARPTLARSTAPSDVGALGLERLAVPIDLAALVPGVLDLEAADLDGMVPYDSGDIDTMAPGQVRLFYTIWADEGAVADYFSNAGHLEPITDVTFMATQFETEEAAKEYFSSLIRRYPVLEDTEVELGDESIVTGVTNSVRGIDYEGVDVTVRLGRLHLDVTIQTQDKSPIRGDEVDLAVELSDGYVDRIESLDALPTDTIGLDPVRFDNASLYNRTNSYVIRDEASVFAYPEESTEEREAITRDTVDSGVVAQYEIEQRLPTEELEAATFGYTVGSRARQFGTVRQAERVFDRVVEGWEENGFSVREIADAPSVGDESIAIEATHTGGGDFVSYLVWRDGPVMYGVFVELPTRLAEHEALFALVDAQTACLDAETCWRGQQLPVEILDDAGPLVDDDPIRGGGDRTTP